MIDRLQGIETLLGSRIFAAFSCHGRMPFCIRTKVEGCIQSLLNKAKISKRTGLS